MFGNIIFVFASWNSINRLVFQCGHCWWWNSAVFINYAKSGIENMIIWISAPESWVRGQYEVSKYFWVAYGPVWIVFWWHEENFFHASDSTPSKLDVTNYVTNLIVWYELGYKKIQKMIICYKKVQNFPFWTLMRYHDVITQGYTQLTTEHR